VNQGVPPAEEVVAPFINGGLSLSQSDATVEVINPSNGRRLLEIPGGCEADVDCAVASARDAFDDGRWSEAPPSQRKQTLHRFADLIQADAAALDGLDAGEMGKPIREVFCSATAAASLMRFYAEAIDKVAGDVYITDKTTLVAQRRVPRGVVAAVVPWNFPTYNAVLKVAPALAAGNCVILKPSELSSRSAMRLARLGLQAGVPPGVLNVVPGRGETVGRALALHQGVDMVAFTGSSAVGKLMMQYAGQSNMKPLMAECGGKSPHIVFRDAGALDSIADTVAQELVTNQGQICSVGSRLLLHRSIESRMVEQIVARVGRIVMGDAMNPMTTFGPIVSRRQCDRIMGFIETAEAEGAQLVAGGQRALLESGGCFVEPTVFRGVSPTARIAQEEIFGPVLSIIAFADEAEAIRIANGTAYGLVASLWTESLSTGLRVAKAIRSAVLINAVSPCGEGPGHALSNEPVGQSGVGTESGLAGMESYLRRHLIWINHG